MYTAQVSIFIASYLENILFYCQSLLLANILKSCTTHFMKCPLTLTRKVATVSKVCIFKAVSQTPVNKTKKNFSAIHVANVHPMHLSILLEQQPLKSALDVLKSYAKNWYKTNTAISGNTYENPWSFLKM